MSATNPPDSPPAFPVIPEGLATKMGKYGTALLALVAALVPLLPDSGAGNSRFFAGCAVAVGVATILGRMLQSAALLYNAPSPALAKPAPPIAYMTSGVAGSNVASASWEMSPARLLGSEAAAEMSREPEEKDDPESRDLHENGIT